ncbi:MAG TPA: HD domain-containing phosphohydrolase, partial [Chloroflexota bacterium]
VLRRRRAKAYDPSVVDLFLARGERWIAEASAGSLWEAVLDAEPEPTMSVAEGELDTPLQAFAEFTDLKSPFTAGHSLGVATLAQEAARHAGLSEVEIAALRLAGLVHDLGRTGIPNGIWDKPAPLSTIEWERVRLHPYLAERMLSYSAPLRRIAPLAGSHHERLDASGYYRQASASALPFPARILAAADAYQAMTQERPHRPAIAPKTAAADLNTAARDGRFDPEAVRAVLAAAGHKQPRRTPWPAGLTDREVEVLRLIAQGHSYKEVARRLTITPKTAEHHIEHIYNKIGVSARASAALFAMEHDLIPG